MDKSVLIRLEHIDKIFLTDEIETWALHDISLEIHDGEYISIMGPSGCGKSTLLSIIGLLSSSSAGLYQLDGDDVSAISQADQARVRNRQIGFIFQAFNLIGDMTIFENIELPLTFRSDLKKKDRKDIVEAMLTKVAMSNRANHFPNQLSGGQQQRVAIARALAGQPKVLLADEPTGNLDSSNSDSVMALLDDFHEEGCTICMVTHNPLSAARANRRVVLLDGKIERDELQA